MEDTKAHLGLIQAPTSMQVNRSIYSGMAFVKKKRYYISSLSLLLSLLLIVSSSYFFFTSLSSAGVKRLGKATRNLGKATVQLAKKTGEFAKDSAEAIKRRHSGEVRMEDNVTASHQRNARFFLSIFILLLYYFSHTSLFFYSFNLVEKLRLSRKSDSGKNEGKSPKSPRNLAYYFFNSN